jgi:ribonuclease P protein component
VKRANRLSKSVDVKRVRRNGKKTAHPFLLLVALPNEQKGLRVAITAGRAVGGAVQRNRAKRVMRAAIQPWLGEIKPDTDILLMARPEILPAKSPVVMEALQGLLKRAKLLK